MSLQRRLASQSTIIFAARIGGSGLVFLTQALIARLWGAALLGDYLLVTATINLIAVVMPLGFHTVGAYFAADYRARGEKRQLAQFMRRAYGHVLGTFVALLLAGYPLLMVLGQTGSALGQHFVPLAVLAFCSGLVHVNGSVLIGLKRPLAGYFADAVVRPMIVLAAFVLALSFAVPDAAFGSMLWIMAIAYLVVALGHFGFVMLTMRTVPDTAEPRLEDVRRWWRFALPWVLISLATDFFFDIDLLLLSHALPKDQLAIFGVCTRIFSLVSFGVAVVYAVTLPDIFESEANADRAAFTRKIGDANLVASGISVLLFAGMAIVGPFALMLFGSSFSAGALPLAILCLALVVRSVMGPASVVLSMHDRPYASLPAVGLGIVSLVVLNGVLVPRFGIIGAALAATLAITLWSVALWWTALRTAKLDVSIVQRFRRAGVPEPV
ncbi:lipopolysaccharide biosynthesis protein [uncultured Devosia sp.]|uniref:lipopolysaccharide biosynthesis protein n=1 Tax=uncultured Devosia sp. TaxID=211434 RepID=UPI0035CB37A6